MAKRKNTSAYIPEGDDNLCDDFNPGKFSTVQTDDNQPYRGGKYAPCTEEEWQNLTPRQKEKWTKIEDDVSSSEAHLRWFSRSYYSLDIALRDVFLGMPGQKNEQLFDYIETRPLAAIWILIFLGFIFLSVPIAFITFWGLAYIFGKMIPELNNKFKYGLIALFCMPIAFMSLVKWYDTTQNTMFSSKVIEGKVNKEYAKYGLQGWEFRIEKAQPHLMAAEWAQAEFNTLSSGKQLDPQLLIRMKERFDVLKKNTAAIRHTYNTHQDTYKIWDYAIVESQFPYFNIKAWHDYKNGNPPGEFASLLPQDIAIDPALYTITKNAYDYIFPDYSYFAKHGGVFGYYTTWIAFICPLCFDKPNSPQKYKMTFYTRKEYLARGMLAQQLDAYQTNTLKKINKDTQKLYGFVQKQKVVLDNALRTYRQVHQRPYPYINPKHFDGYFEEKYQKYSPTVPLQYDGITDYQVQDMYALVVVHLVMINLQIELLNQ